ncbi:MAG: hypothetical protein MK101_08130 [Phycisphaerales bacterium]|nr:hypothetical protein [Phycisphaerales bacterium]
MEGIPVFFKTCAAAAAIAMIAGSAAADVWIAEEAPAWRGDEGAAHYLWESFTSASAADGPNFPTNEAWPSGDALLFNFADGAFVSGEGNIYGFGGPLNIHTYLYADADVQEVVLNVSTLGSEIDYSSLMLAWTTGDGGNEGMLFGEVSMNYWEEIDFGQGVGALVNASWSFDLSSIADDVREIGLIFQGSGAHMSLDAVGVDILTAVPAPGVLSLAALAGLAFRRRRR